VVGAGRRTLIVTVLPSRGDVALAKKKLDELVETIKMI